MHKTAYDRLTGKDRRFIKGQQDTRLSHRENLTTDDRWSLTRRLKTNKRLNRASLLQEEFGQLWDYERKGWARRFLENWRVWLTWQRLAPYEKFAQMIDPYWDGIAGSCQPKNKVAWDSSRA